MWTPYVTTPNSGVALRSIEKSNSFPGPYTGYSSFLHPDSTPKVLLSLQYAQVAAIAALRSFSVGWWKALMVRSFLSTSSSPLMPMGTLARALNTDSRM